MQGARFCGLDIRLLREGERIMHVHKIMVHCRGFNMFSENDNIFENVERKTASESISIHLKIPYIIFICIFID